MYRQAAKLLALLILIVAGSVALWRYERYRSAQYEIEKRDQEIRRLEAQKQQLQDFITRLGNEKRVAEVLVTDQTQGPSGVESTTLLMVEYARDGKQTLPPRFFTVKGTGAHLDALVIKFERSFLFENDPLRGHSIVLFYRLFGDHQTPKDAFFIDEPGQIPDIYRAPNPNHDPNQQAAQQFEQELWANFWRLTDDPEYRKEKGVRVANPESLWRDFRPDQLYTITLESSGGLNITSRPLEGIWKTLAALKRNK